jgi:hypothetical protein
VVVAITAAVAPSTSTTLTIAGVSIPAGATVSLCKTPKLRGLWLSLVFTPYRSESHLTGFVRSALGSDHYLIDGYEDIKQGMVVSGLPFFMGQAVVTAVKHLEGGAGKCFTSLVLDRPALLTASCVDCYQLTVSGETSLVINGGQSLTSIGQGACGALQITINRNHSDALSRWGEGAVGRWDLRLNSGWSQGSPVSSDVLQSGILVSV